MGWQAILESTRAHKILSQDSWDGLAMAAMAAMDPPWPKASLHSSLQSNARLVGAGATSMVGPPWEDRSVYVGLVKIFGQF